MVAAPLGEEPANIVVYWPESIDGIGHQVRCNLAAFGRVIAFMGLWTAFGLEFVCSDQQEPRGTEVL